MADAISRVWTSNSPEPCQGPVGPYAVWLLGKLGIPPLRRAIPLIFPTITWNVDQDPVDLLLQIARNDRLLPHIATEIWTLLKERPSLPRVCRGRWGGTAQRVVQHIRRLGDTEILKSYYLIVWSEWDYLYPDGLDEMEISIREDFGGIGMKGHRRDLMEQLDRVLGELEDPSHDNSDYKKEQYGRLRQVLLEFDRES